MKKLIFPALMSCYMALMMTCLITWINTGFDNGFWGRWLTAFYIAWPIAALLMYIGAQRIRDFSEKLATKL